MKINFLNISTALAVSLAMIAAAGCSSDSTTVYHPYDGTEEAEEAKDENGIYVLFAGTGSTEEELKVDVNGNIGETFATSITYDMYTNEGDWKIVPDYSECFYPESSWVKSWPAQGSGDGRFTLTFTPNSGTYAQGDTRHVNINIVASKSGRIIKTITADQAGASNVRLELVATFMSTLTFVAENAKATTVPIDANVAWDAVVEDPDATWLHIVDIQKFSLTIAVDDNPDRVVRQATIMVYQVSDSDNNLIITVKQNAWSILTNVVAKAAIKATVDEEVSITANGAKVGERVIFENPDDMTLRYYSDVVSVGESNFTFFLPADMPSGKYDLYYEGIEEEFMFTSEVTVVDPTSFVTDVVPQPIIVTTVGAKITIEAKGALATDVIKLESLEGGENYNVSVTDVTADNFAIELPQELAAGAYHLSLVRDTYAQDLFDTVISFESVD